MPDDKDFIMALIHCHPGGRFSLEELSEETALPSARARAAAAGLVAQGELSMIGQRYGLNRQRPGGRVPPRYDRRSSIT